MPEETPQPKLMSGDAINWRAVPQIKVDLDVIAENRQLLDPSRPSYRPVGEQPNTSDWFRAEVGKELVLHVTVTDTDLAQAVLMAAFGPNSRVPGLDITNVVLNPEAQTLSSNADMLRQIADNLEEQAQSIPNAFQ